MLPDPTPSSDAPAPPRGGTTVVIEPRPGWRTLGLAELWEYRDLVGFLALRRLKSRHRQTLLGPLWFLVQPVVQMVIFTFVFGTLAKLPSGEVPYALFTFAALVPWAYFTDAATSSVGSLAEHIGIISKVYFPRLTIPVAAVLAGLLDLGIAVALLVGMAVFLGVVPSLSLLALPVFTALALVTGLAVGLWLATLTVWFRDLRMIVALLLQAWMFATPVAYAASLIPEAWQGLYRLNPMFWVVEGFRWSVLGTAAPDWAGALPALGLVTAGLVGGAFVFRRTERNLVDVM